MVRLVTLLQSPEQVTAAFKKYDADQSNGLDMNELLAMIADAFPTATADEKRALIYHLCSVDTDRDGYISLEEIQRALAPYFAQREEHHVAGSSPSHSSSGQQSYGYRPAGHTDPSAHRASSAGAHDAHHYAAASPSREDGLVALETLVRTLKSNPGLLHSAAMGRGFAGAPPKDKWGRVLEDAMPGLSDASAELVAALLRLEIRSGDQRVAADTTDASTMLLTLERILDAARGLGHGRPPQAVAEFGSWAGYDGRGLLEW